MPYDNGICEKCNNKEVVCECLDKVARLKERDFEFAGMAETEIAEIVDARAQECPDCGHSYSKEQIHCWRCNGVPA